MNEEEKLRNESERMQTQLQKENLIDGAIKVYEQTRDSKIISLSNSRVQFAGDTAFIHLKDESYNTCASYRHRNGKYDRLED